MGVTFLQRVAGPDGNLAASLRALKFGAGLTVVSHPDETLSGAQGGDGQVTGYHEVLATAALPIGINVETLPGVDVTGATDSTDGLNAAMAAASPGDVFVLPPKALIKTSDKIRMTVQGVRLLGQGRQSIIRASAANFHIFSLEAHDLWFDGISLEGAATDQVVLAPLIRCGFGFYTDATVYQPKRVKIFNCYLGEQTLGTSLNNAIKQDTGCDYWEVAFNYFQRMIGDDADTLSAGYYLLSGQSNYGKYHHNVFIADQYQSVPMGHHAVYLTGGSSYNIVESNYARNFAQDTFPTNSHGSSPPCQYNKNFGNVVEQSGYGSIGTPNRSGSGVISWSGNCSYNEAFSNTILDCAMPGILHNDTGRGGRCYGNRDYDNHIIRSGAEGTRIQGAKRSYSFNRVTDCSQIAHGSVSAVYLLADNDSTAEACEDNVVGVIADTERVFYVGGATGNTVNPSILDTYGKFIIVAITSANPMVVTLSELCNGVNGDTVTIAGVTPGTPTANGTHTNCTFGTTTYDGRSVSTITLTGVDGHLDAAYQGDFPGVCYARKNHGGQSGATYAKVLGALGNTAINGERVYTIDSVGTDPLALSRIKLAVAGNGAWSSGGRILLPTHRVGIRHNTTSPTPTGTVHLAHSSILPINGVEIDLGSSVTTPTTQTQSGGASLLSEAFTVPRRDSAGGFAVGWIGVGLSTLASAGEIRGDAVMTAKARNAANSADLNIYSVDGSDDMTFGDATNGQTTIVASSDLVRISVGGTVISVQASLVSFNVGLQLNNGAVTMASNVSSPIWRIADATTTSATGTPWSLHGQNMTGTTSIGGDVTWASGTGTSHCGVFALKAGASSRITMDATGIGFYSAATVAQQTVTGSRGSNAALASLLTALAALGLIVDGSS